MAGICSHEYRKKNANRRRLEIVKSRRSNSNFKKIPRGRVGLKSPLETLRGDVSRLNASPCRPIVNPPPLEQLFHGSMTTFKKTKKEKEQKKKRERKEI